MVSGTEEVLKDISVKLWGGQVCRFANSTESSDSAHPTRYKKSQAIGFLGFGKKGSDRFSFSHSDDRFFPRNAIALIPQKRSPFTQTKETGFFR